MKRGLGPDRMLRRPKLPASCIRLRRPVAALLLALAALHSQASAVEPLGSAVGVVPAASSQLDGRTVRILTGSDLYEGQVITTDSRGQVQILFTDDTRMVVGPDSTLVLETYLMRNANSVGSFAAKALGGTFRFVTGDSAKDAYKIITPTGTIGVRGTEFDFFVETGSGQTLVNLFGGQVRICPNVGSPDQCITLSKRCALGALLSNGKSEVLDRRRNQFTTTQDNFPYILSQAALR